MAVGTRWVLSKHRPSWLFTPTLVPAATHHYPPSAPLSVLIISASPHILHLLPPHPSLLTPPKSPALQCQFRAFVNSLPGISSFAKEGLIMPPSRGQRCYLNRGISTSSEERDSVIWKSSPEQFFPAYF